MCCNVRFQVMKVTKFSILWRMNMAKSSKIRATTQKVNPQGASNNLNGLFIPHHRLLWKNAREVGLLESPVFSSSDDHETPTRHKKWKETKLVSDAMKGFRLAGAAKEYHKSKLYSIAWSSDLFVKSSDKDSSDSTAESTDNGLIRCFATCGGQALTLYEVDCMNGPLSRASTIDSGFRVRQVYIDADEKEDYYTCVFGGRGVGSPLGYGPISRCKNESVVLDSKTVDDEDTSKREPSDERLANWIYSSDSDGPQLILVAGEQGIIKVVDVCHRRLHLTLSGHGDAIYDLKISPQNPWLLLSASKDESIRLFNFWNATCIAVFSGHEGHKASVLSLDWHPSGDMFVSSSIDATVKIWSLEAPYVQEHLKKCSSISPYSRMRRSQWKSKENNSTFRPLLEQLPIYSTTKVHLDYIDCVQFVGDMILSKSTKNVISLWKPVLDSPLKSRRNMNDIVHLRDFQMNQCNVWFIRFHTDSKYRYLACGNNIGDIEVWELDSMSPQCRRKFTLTDPICNSTIRMVSFSPEQDSLIAVCDDSTVWKWDFQV